MKDHESTKFRTSTTRVRSGGSSSSDSVLLPVETTNVSYFLSADGDRRNPNPHRYAVFAWKDFEGIDGLYVTSPDPNSYYSVETVGVVGNNASDLHFAYSLQDETTVLNTALSRLYEQLRGNLDLSIDIAEAKSTKAMFSLENQIRNFHGRLPKAKVLGSLWLQAQYGWLPLAGTIYGVCDEIFRQQTNNWARLKARCSDQELFYPRERQSDGTVNKYIVLNNSKVEFKVGYQLSGFSLQNWTSLNPASIAWELTPFSFVVDWIYNVGDYVRSMETALLSGKAFTGGYVTIVRGQQNYIQRSFAGRRPGNPKNYVSLLDATGSSRRIEYSRTILTAPPIPRPPIVSVDLSWKRLFSGASLLAQLLPDNERGPRQSRGSHTA